MSARPIMLRRRARLHPELRAKEKIDAKPADTHRPFRDHPPPLAEPVCPDPVEGIDSRVSARSAHAACPHPPAAGRRGNAYRLAPRSHASYATDANPDATNIDVNPD